MTEQKSVERADLRSAAAAALRRGPKHAHALMAELQVSQPTLSRTLKSMAEVTMFRVKGSRSPMYGLVKNLPYMSARQEMYRYLSNGSVEPFAKVEFLSGGGTLEWMGKTARLYEGLPPYMLFAAPSGFLGRQLAQDAAAAMTFPSSLKDWRDEHRAHYLFTMGLNLAGNLVFGRVSLQRELDLGSVRPVPIARKAVHYQQMANRLKKAAYGSSAGGEQPKFLSATEDSGHVIVKFAKRGSRMAELLPLEHLALRSLAEVGVPASTTQLIAAGDFVFLEVKRFDRVGSTGRVGMLSAGSVDDEFFGQRDTWSQFAERCQSIGAMSETDAFNVNIMVAFSELIGNDDRHFENLSMLIDEDGEYRGVAPAYDILPMRYATLGAGVDPDLEPIVPKIGQVGARPEVWARAAEAAERFWTAAQTEDLGVPLPRAFKELAADNLKVAREFVAPLLPVVRETPLEPEPTRGVPSKVGRSGRSGKAGVAPKRTRMFKATETPKAPEVAEPPDWV